ncbi:MAG TPA: toll/interleukin-1 receptor domain-containing protein [Pyrinomonadaceae bacterium]|nr:toll/interleukin-1 receptor domain-containing protein [Pyrinomonadaceae bacterium]
MTKRASSPRQPTPRGRSKRSASVKKPLVFIGWSGDQSKVIARELKDLLELVINMCDPWMSAVDIAAGAAWNERLIEALEAAEFAVVCLTKSNCNAPWIHFEVGFLSRSKNKPVCPYLFDIQPSEISGPLALLNAKNATPEDTFDLLTAINETLRAGVTEKALSKHFNSYWPDFANALRKLSETEPAELVPPEVGKGFVEGMWTMQRKEEGPSKPKPEPDKQPSKASKTRGKTAAARAAKRGAWAFTLEVINPSDHSRKGQVVVPWELIYEAKKIPPQKLTVYDKFGNPLPTQVELDDSGDPARATLLFALQDSVPGPDAGAPPYLVHAEIGTPPAKAPGARPRIEVEAEGEDERRVRLINSRLEIRLELFPIPWNDDRDFYAGAASSVQLVGEEILSSLKFGPIHYEKRCMQIADLWLLSPTERLVPGEHAIIRQPYQLISQSSGPVRASVKIASAAFDCSYLDSSTRSQIASKCRLYREISLYEDGDYVVESLHVQNASAAAKGGKDKIDHRFKARYFTFADFGEVKKVHYNPEWLMMYSDWPLYRGYGFAADVQILIFENPVPKFPHAKLQHNTFSWVLSPDKTHTCLHLFMKGEFNDLQAQVHNTWQDVIKEPLLVKVK